MPSFSVPEETASSGSQPFHTELGKGAIFPSGGKGDKEKKWRGSGERGAPEAHRNYRYDWERFHHTNCLIHPDGHARYEKVSMILSIQRGAGPWNN